MDGVKSWVWMCSFLPSCGHLQVGLVRKLPVGKQRYFRLVLMTQEAGILHVGHYICFKL